MTCPSCRSENEMLFSVLSLGFICSEANCGLEIQVDVREAEVLLWPDLDLILA